MQEIREDPLHRDRHVLLSTGRSERPDETSAPDVDAGPRDDCVFCRGNEDMTPPAIREEPEDGWTFRLIENKYPALRRDPEEVEDGTGFLSPRPSYGRHEILVESGDHRPYHALSVEEKRHGLQILKERFLELERDADIEYVTVFKNAGDRAGASLSHSHTQLLAAPVVPEEIAEETAVAAEYSEEEGRCLLCDLIQQEIDDGARVIETTEHVAVVCPYASIWPYQVRIVPRTEMACFEEVSDAVLDDIAAAIDRVMDAYAAVLDDVPYNMVFHSYPARKDGHFFVELFPREKTMAGAELAGLYINEVAPAEAAEVLRDES